ncbi:UDP-glucose dehydrogenase family protein [Paenibacillus sp. YAF4_2]|uniref:UDP-glucose dehydrogenase family protein n=1 Tax=Paenibacillus sp. YAF4_2 TaxID=3233085 RepID=UPI003F95A4B0
MDICIIGAGYVGLTTAAVLADIGHTVFCTDRDEAKIDKLKQGVIPVYEPGLSAMLLRNMESGKLIFDTSVSAYISQCPILMIAVGAPPSKDGSADLSAIHSVVRNIADMIRSPKTIVIKSTVPPGTADQIKQWFLTQLVSPDLFHIVSNPEFLREGTAIYDTQHPDRIVIGAVEQSAALQVKELYKTINTTFLLTTNREAELIKYASNAFLAVKISFINEISKVCEAFDADITRVAEGIGLDKRIGPQFLQAGLGYGGSCLPRDVDTLIHAAESKQMKLRMLTAAKKINRSQLSLYVNKLKSKLGECNHNQRIAVWGATFKENTDDIRASQAIALMKKLTKLGYHVYAYDPLAHPSLPSVIWCESAYEAVEQADALIVATCWPEFVEADWLTVKQAMRRPVILDGRNRLNRAKLESLGFEYTGIGRP